MYDDTTSSPPRPPSPCRPCGAKAGEGGLGGSGGNETGRRPGRTGAREVIVAGINHARDEFVRLRGLPPSHVGIPDSYRMDLVGDSACGLQIRWLDGDAHCGIIVWREAGA